jgi:hypothetical protein
MAAKSKKNRKKKLGKLKKKVNVSLEQKTPVTKDETPKVSKKMGRKLQAEAKKEAKAKKKSSEKNIQKEKPSRPVETKNKVQENILKISSAASEVLNGESVKIKKESKIKKFFRGFFSVIGRILRPFKWPFIILLILCVLAGVAVAGVYYYFSRDLPDVSQLKSLNFAETTTIYDREGNVLYKIFGEENREYVPLAQIDKKIINATIAIEDKNFYKHFGFDPVGIVRAQINNLKEDSAVQGASTITQQLAKNIYLSPEKTMERKMVL